MRKISLTQAAVLLSCLPGSLCTAYPADAPMSPAHQTHPAKKHSGKHHAQAGFPAGTPKIWEDRGALTLTRVYFGANGMASDPLSRLPAPPFGHFEPDTTEGTTSPKAKLTDSKGVKWTAKMGVEVHSDTVAPRLAWALGFGSVEGYYVASGKIEGVDATTNLGLAKGTLQTDGSFQGGARFKRHDDAAAPIHDAKGNDLNWNEAQNPGVPPEQLSGLLLFEDLVNNWDAQPKNCKVYHVDGPKGPENWYLVSDLGASFAGGPRHKWVLADYQKSPDLIKRITNDTVELNFNATIHAQARIHQRVPLAHAQWFRKQLAKLTNDELQATFDAAFATEGLNKAYASGDSLQIKAAREQELTPETRMQIAAFVAKLRARIDEFMQKVPEGA